MSENSELTIVLAAYANLDNARNQLEQRSSTRFNFYLALATASIAVAAGLLSNGWEDSTTVASVAVLGAMVILFGWSVFGRQVQFEAYEAHLMAAQEAVAGFLASKAPWMQPNLMVANASPGTSIAGIIALVNSSLLALAAGVTVGLYEFGIAAAITAAVVFAVSIAAHFAYGRIARHKTARNLAPRAPVTT